MYVHLLLCQDQLPPPKSSKRRNHKSFTSNLNTSGLSSSNVMQLNPSHASLDVPQVQVFTLIPNSLPCRAVRRLSTSCSAVHYFILCNLTYIHNINLFYFRLQAIVFAKFIHHAVFSATAK